MVTNKSSTTVCREVFITLNRPQSNDLFQSLSQSNTVTSLFIYQPAKAFCSLDGQLELLALENLVVVDVEKVAVENRLDQAGDNGNPIHLMVGLCDVAVDPVGDVEGAVESEGEEVVSRDGFCLASALQHKQLREDGHRLEPDGKGPHDLGGRVIVGKGDGEDGGTAKEVLHSEGIDVDIVGGLVGVGHEIDDIALGADEEDLEDEVVDAVGRKEIEVSSEVDEQIQALRLEGDARTALELHHLVQQDEDTR